MKQLLFFVISLVLLMCLFFCTTGLTGNGGSSETLNAKVRISDTTLSIIIDDKNVASLKLHLFSRDYQPYEKFGFHDSCEINYSTFLHWKSPPEGTFNALITTDNSKFTCFIPDINIGNGADTTLEVCLEKGLQITGKLITGDNTPLQESYLISIYGTPFFTITGNEKNFRFEMIPSGQFTLSVHPVKYRLFRRTSDFFFNTDSLGEYSRLQLSLP